MKYADLCERLRKRADIRRQIPTRKSVQEGKPDRIADLLEEAAIALEDQDMIIEKWNEQFASPTKECCVCGTTENLHKDGFYGYRCDSDGCVPF